MDRRSRGVCEAVEARKLDGILAKSARERYMRLLRRRPRTTAPAASASSAPEDEDEDEDEVDDTGDAEHPDESVAWR